MWYFVFMMFFIMILLGIFTGLAPLYSRQATPFGVAVTGKHEFVEGRKKRYAMWNIIVSVLLGLPLFLFPSMEDIEQAEMMSSIYILVAMVGFMIYSFLLFLHYRKEIREWKETRTEKKENTKKRLVVDTTYHEKLSTRSHFTFFIWQFLIIAATVAIALIFYDRIPEEIPIQWGADFEVNRTIEKSLWGVLALPVIQLLMIPVFNYSHHAIIQSKQKLSPLDPKSASEKSRQFREAWSNFLFFTTIATQLLISFLTIFSLFGEHLSMWLLAVSIGLYLLFIIGGAIYLTVKYGQGGEKLLNEDEQFYTDPEDEEKWLLGVIYYDRDDPSVFVEKRFGVGTTLNVGNWKAWLFIGGLILFIILTIVWSAMLE